MSRSFITVLNRLAREAERSSRAEVRAQAAHVRQQQRDTRLLDKQEKADYFASRAAEAERENANLTAYLGSLVNILPDALQIDPSIDPQSLKLPELSESFLARKLEQDAGVQPMRSSFGPKPQGFFARFVPGASKRHAARLAQWDAIFNRQVEEYATKKRKIAGDLQAQKLQAESYNRSIDEFISKLASSDSDAIKAYFELVFQRSKYPEGFPKTTRIAHVADSRQLVIDYQMPTIDTIISTAEKYKYTKASDEISQTNKTEKARQSLYTTVIASTVLRTIHELFAGGGFQQIDVAVVNAFVETIDPSTGQRIQPYIISVRTTRDAFAQLDLRNVEPAACLRRLSASISRSPAELVPIKPIVDINMVDPRFIREQDVLSSLDNRTNLMELTPGAFESLITNLFQKMGLETKLTQASRDGGVDCVAFDQRPILGGKVVVQAKRYKNTVGVGSVRDLYGTMLNEGASKGILVTTSGYGKASFEFANGKPIELLTGANLLYLLHEHAGIDAKIEPPEDWVDFQASSQ